MNYDSLSQDQREHIISSGLELMNAITSAFGPNEGITTWEKVSDAMGETFKHELFMAMLQGRMSGGISLRWRNIGNTGKQYVQFIKSIRNLTGWGLKEAKDFADELYTSGIVKILKITEGRNRSDAIKLFREIQDLEAY